MNNGKLKWFGNLEQLKSFLEFSVGLSENGHHQAATLKSLYMLSLNSITNFVLLGTLHSTTSFKVAFTELNKAETEFQNNNNDVNISLSPSPA